MFPHTVHCCSSMPCLSKTRWFCTELIVLKSAVSSDWPELNSVLWLAWIPLPSAENVTLHVWTITSKAILTGGTGSSLLLTICVFVVVKEKRFTLKAYYRAKGLLLLVCPPWCSWNLLQWKASSVKTSCSSSSPGGTEASPPRQGQQHTEKINSLPEHIWQCHVESNTGFWSVLAQDTTLDRLWKSSSSSLFSSAVWCVDFSGSVSGVGFLSTERVISGFRNRRMQINMNVTDAGTAAI